MAQFVETFSATLVRLDIWALFDITIVAFIIYGLISFVRGTTASSVLYGLILILAAFFVVRSIPELVVLNWLLGNSLPFLWVAVLVLFQPELRRAFERIGRVRRWVDNGLGVAPGVGSARAINEVCHTARRLAELRFGGIIVFERATGLQEYAETGTMIDAVVSTELLLNIFFPNSPMHDGAVIIHGDRVVAARCLLPLSSNVAGYTQGTRHRAAIGITEVTDAVCVVVSEERRTISLANNGRIVGPLDEERLRTALTLLLRARGDEPPPPWQLSWWPRRNPPTGGRPPASAGPSGRLLWRSEHRSHRIDSRPQITRRLSGRSNHRPRCSRHAENPTIQRRLAHLRVHAVDRSVGRRRQSAESRAQ